MECENKKCNKKHDGSFGSGRFCCRSCANSKPKSLESRQKLSAALGGVGYLSDGKCLSCGELVPRLTYKFCSITCQNSFKYKTYIEKWLAGKVSGGKGACGLVSGYVRRYLFDKHSNSCQKCGWSEINTLSNRVPLAVHHVDGDCKNNKEENLELLCPNCHSLTPTHGSLNRGNSTRFKD